MKKIFTDDWGVALAHMVRALVPVVAFLITIWAVAASALRRLHRAIAAWFWLSKYKKQLLQFPSGAFDDQVDSNFTGNLSAHWYLKDPALAPTALSPIASKPHKAVACPPRPPVAPNSERPKPRPARRARKTLAGQNV